MGRFLYPLLYGLYGHFTLIVEFSTQLGYMALGALLLSLYGQVFFDAPLIGDFVQQWYLPFCLIGGWMLFGLIQLNVVGFAVYFPVYKRGLEWKREFDAHATTNANDS